MQDTFSEGKSCRLIFVAQELASKSRRNLYYWASKGSAEVDFLLEGEHEIYPLEVKSGETSRKKSLLIYGKKYSPEFLSRTTPMNLKKDGNICNYPLYLISRFLQI